MVGQINLLCIHIGVLLGVGLIREGKTLKAKEKERTNNMKGKFAWQMLLLFPYSHL